MKNILLFCFLFGTINGFTQKPKTTATPKPADKEIPGNETANSSTPGFFSPIVPIPYKGIITPPQPAQAKDHLLWYTGKKVNDSMLVTTDAKLVLFSKGRDMVVVQPNSKKDPWLKTIKRLEAIEEDKKKVVNAASGKPNDFFLYPHVTATLKKYEQQNEEYAKALKNTISLPEAIPAVALRPSPAGGYASVYFAFIAGVPAAVKQAFDDVMQKKKNYPSLNFPPPPQDDFGACYQYDGIAQNQHYIDNYKWEQEFVKYEKDLVNLSLSIVKTIELLKLNADPEAIQIKTDLDKVIEFAFARMKNKVELLIRNYGKDFTRLPAVVRMAVSYERQKQLMGTNEEATGEVMLELVSLLDGFDKYIEQQIAARNYDVVFNVAFMLGIERQKQLLGTHEEYTTSPADILYRIFMPFNRFRIEMAVDYAMSCNNDDGTCQFITETGSLATQKDFYISLIPDKYGGYQMLLRDIIYLPEVEDIGSEMHYTLNNVNMVGKYDLLLKTSDGQRKTIYVDDEGKQHINTESYAGAEMFSRLPIGRIYFCKGREDTLYLLEYYNKEGRSLANPKHPGINLIFHSSEEQLDAKTTKLLGDTEAYTKRMKSYEVEPTGFEKLDKQQNQYKIVEMYQNNAQNIAKYMMSKDAAIMFDAENGVPEIMNANADVSGKQIEDIKINKGVIKIKITHDPLPYIKKDKKKDANK